MDLIGGIFIMLVALLLVIGICLGLLIALVAGRRRDVANQGHTVRAEDTSEASSPQGIQTQLDRIGVLAQRANISSVRLTVLAIGLAAVIFAGTGLQIPLWGRLLALFAGLGGILAAPRLRR